MPLRQYCNSLNDKMSSGYILYTQPILSSKSARPLRLLYQLLLLKLKTFCKSKAIVILLDVLSSYVQDDILLS